ncbi:uncharacterized protein MYCFIDRAFT_76486 [Pseudocercospora fijiensis CIRAD86]|uniref:Uncharacterized protein n=1 Tax=Pseudocercospora fijiensis (strain CIRAD86) TaxID=383855 RepID=N1QCG5_PSEFD|nr:uncharacterized protein MYCFIDRAFT_76486 [Pseudocercospora fijiensis CIRAD86]EME89123.1 hypothetical protein MYCFIDRAFT_76486 [Pseudocercospora fijiensis CIRAD86]
MSSAPAKMSSSSTPLFSRRKIFRRTKAPENSKRGTFEIKARKSMDAVTVLFKRVINHDLRKHKIPRLSGEAQRVVKQEREQVFPPELQKTSTDSVEAGDARANDDRQESVISEQRQHSGPQQEVEIPESAENEQASSRQAGEDAEKESDPECYHEAIPYQASSFEPVGFHMLQLEQQEHQTLDPQAEQAIRDTQYVTIAPEIEDDYTRGPARFVAVSDGIMDDAGALLMTYDLSQKIKQAMRLQREHAREQRHVESQQMEISMFLRELEIEIMSHESRIEVAQDGSEEAQQDEQTVAKLQVELESLELIRTNMEWKRDNLAANLHMKSALLIEAQGEVAQILDEAFVCAALLDPEVDEEMPVEVFDLQAEYQKLHARQQADAEEDDAEIIYEPVAPLDTSKDHLEIRAPTPTPEERAEQDLRQNFWAAKERVREATEEFELREGVRDQEKQFNEQAWATGETALDADREAFDLRWFVRIHEITHELVEAEAALKQAQVAAREGQVELFDDEQSQGFADDAADGRHGSGYDVSDDEMTRFFAYTKDDARINAWLDNVSEGGEAESARAADVDQWASREVDISDSFTVVAFEPARREQIAEWQRQCDAVRDSCRRIEEAEAEQS